MDPQSTPTAFSNLIQQHPDLNMTIISDVLQACDHDLDRAYATICEMVIPPETPIPATPKSPPRAPVQYAFNHSPTTPSTPRRAAAPPLQGAWARNMGRRLRVDDMCNKYTWIKRTVVEELFERNSDCVELVETEILHMFPIDEPAAFGETPQPREGETNPAFRGTAIAASLRAQAEDEMRRARAGGSDTVSMLSPDMQAMRRRLWETRDIRGRLHHLANQTRNKAYVARAKETDEELQRLSETFLDNIRNSVEYRNGVVDLHGLTKDEAIQIVEWKLEDGRGKRFRLITGRGNHSHNYQAVLKPALEKHFRSKRVSFTQIEDGVLSVILP